VEMCRVVANMADLRRPCPASWSGHWDPGRLALHRDARGITCNPLPAGARVDGCRL